MKPFVSVALPHPDVLSGKLTMDVFAADLWGVYKGRAPEEYQNPEIFFAKTYLTKGLENLLQVVQKRLNGGGGDAVIQLQTPFGGGKTHTLIALYHKAKEWGTNLVVIDGTAFDPKQTTIWEEIEYQLNGTKEMLLGKTAPGTENLRKVLEGKQPILILMDEVLQFATKAAGIKVGNSDLGAQTLAFFQELTTVVKTLERGLIVVTLPSSIMEHYDETAEKLFQQLQKVIGRTEKMFAPVEEDEISQVIRKRLFSQVNERESKEIIDAFVDYFEKEKIIESEDKFKYREKFIKSYPFQPEVIDVLYQRWGSFPTFQRTRGVLRILGLVIYTLKNKQIPIIRLCDFDLGYSELRMELLKFIGQEYDSVLSADITSVDSGAKKVDNSLGESYKPYQFGTKCATTIFMYSFSGGVEKGAKANEIKLACAQPEVNSSIIVETLQKLKENLFYLSDAGYYFTNQPNLNKILYNKIEMIDEVELKENEFSILKNMTKSEKLSVYLEVKNTKDVPDTIEMKLVIMNWFDKGKCDEILKSCGTYPRVYINNIFFLCPVESERQAFLLFLRKKLAWEKISQDKKLNLTPEQEKETNERLKRLENDLPYELRKSYRMLLIPSKDGFKELDLGYPTYGKVMSIPDEVYERLRNEEEILENLHYSVILDKYLRMKDYVETLNIYNSFLQTPGELRIISKEVLVKSIREGVYEGVFGLGKLENNEPVCLYFKKSTDPQLTEGELIIKKELCVLQSTLGEKIKTLEDKIYNIKNKEEFQDLKKEIENDPIIPYDTKEKLKSKIEEKIIGIDSELKSTEKIKNINLKFEIPFGKWSDLANLSKILQSHFRNCLVSIEFNLSDGTMDKRDYEDKVKEALIQMNAKILLEQLSKEEGFLEFE
ncbi:MAG: DUF499 domain-containing protein [Ignavibacteria bacterium]|nr:DUF499 domain-containing protein [Ignavibacteria bacterium]